MQKLPKSLLVPVLALCALGAGMITAAYPDRNFGASDKEAPKSVAETPSEEEAEETPTVSLEAYVETTRDIYQISLAAVEAGHTASVITYGNCLSITAANIDKLESDFTQLLELG